jgi:hypothetical protein
MPLKHSSVPHFFVSITRSISKPITADKIVDFIEQVHDYSLSGLRLTFNPKNTPASAVNLAHNGRQRMERNTIERRIALSKNYLILEKIFMKAHGLCITIISLVATVSLAQEYTGKIIFPTVQIARDYGKLLTEHPTPDSSDWTHMRFSNYFYQRRHPKTWEEIKHYLKFGDIMEQSFLDQLQRIIRMRHDAGLRGHFVRVLHPEPGSHFVIISNLNGAFHTLSRILEYLNYHGNIDDNFVLEPPIIWYSMEIFFMIQRMVLIRSFLY